MPAIPWIVQVGIAVVVGMLVFGFGIRWVLGSVYGDSETERPDSPPPAHGRDRKPPGA